MASSVPDNAPEHCPGTQSEAAGKAEACQGCPNQAVCLSAPQGPDPDLAAIADRLSHVANKILILSGKGGVGKSTITKELAYLLANPIGHDRLVGVLDVDICGPSLPRLFGAANESLHRAADGFEPVTIHDNLTLASVQFLLDPEARNDPLIWRGPQKNGVIKKMLRDVQWGTLDVLLVDTPPGTSDEHISMASLLHGAAAAAAGKPELATSFQGITGAVVITSPSPVAINDVRRELTFCRKARIPVLGLVENFGAFICPCCKTASHVFPGSIEENQSAEAMLGQPSLRTKELAAEFDVPILGVVPLDPSVMQACEQGESFSMIAPDAAASKALRSVASQVVAHLVQSQSQSQF